MQPRYEQLEFADWFPGPVILKEGTTVTMSPRNSFDGKDYSGCTGTVVKHLLEDPCTVSIQITDDQMKRTTLQVNSSILEILSVENEGASTTQQVIDVLLSPSAGAGKATLIGYNEFICDGKTEREYWLSAIEMSPPIKAGQLPLHVNPTRDLKLCVVHVQYRASDTGMSEVERVSLRETSSIELRAHQDKCRPCEMCAQRKCCTICQADGGCSCHADCCHCPNLKWQDHYGRQLRDEHCSVAESIVSRTTECTFQAPLDDARQRRFAFVVGNESYIKRPGSIFAPLGNVKRDVIQIRDQLLEFRFKVHEITDQNKADLEREVAAWTRKLPENAEALVFLSGHGIEFEESPEQFFVPVDYTIDDMLKIVQTTKEKCVTLKWIRERVLDVLRHEGLLMSFWDCCRGDPRKPAVVRGADFCHRNTKKELSKVKQTSSRSASQLSVFACMPGTLAHIEKSKGGVLTQALLAWWRDKTHVALSVGDDVRKFVSAEIERSENSLAQQELQWVWEGGCKSFTFKPGIDSSAATPFIAGGAYMQSAPTAAAAGSSIGASITVQQKGSTHEGVMSSADLDENLAVGTGGGSHASDPVLEWKQPDWPALNLGSANKTPWPFTILFVGVNSNEKIDINLKEEFDQMETAFDVAFSSLEIPLKPDLKPILCLKWSDVIHQLRRMYPTILHFGCHSKGNGLELHGKTVQPGDMIKTIQSHNHDAHRRGKAEIQVIILNACKSDGHAKELLKCVNFSIGHHEDVLDEHAIEFTRSLYRDILQETSLSESFNMATMASSKGYQLHANKDPSDFCLVRRNLIEVVFSRSCEMGHNFMSKLLEMVAKGMAFSKKQSPEIQLITPRQSLLQDSGAKSQASTRPVTRANSPAEICAVHVDGDVKKFQEDLRKFIFPGGPEGQPQQKWGLCKLVLIAILRENLSTLCKSKDKTEREADLQKWRSQCSGPGDDFVKHFDGLLTANEPPACGFDSTKVETKQFELCIFVLDKFVLQELIPEEEKYKWKEDVNKNWFELKDTDSAADFLDRAEIFFRESFSNNPTRGAKILGTLIPVNSYVVFFRMDALASLLMREHCLVQHVLDHQLQPQQAQAAGQHQPSTSRNKVNFLVSSANWHEEWLSEAKRPILERVTELVARLQQIASLPNVLLEANEVPLDMASAVKVQV